MLAEGHFVIFCIGMYREGILLPELYMRMIMNDNGNTTISWLSRRFPVCLFTGLDNDMTSDPRLLAVEFIFGIMLREPQVQAMANIFSEVPIIWTFA